MRKFLLLLVSMCLSFVLVACEEEIPSDEGLDGQLSNSAVLSSLTIAGETVNINESNKTGTVTLPLGTDLAASAKAVEFTLSENAKLFFGDDSSTDEITVSDNERLFAEGANKFTVLAEDGETSATYTVTVAIAKSSSAVLSSLTIAGETVTINESNKTGTVTLPYGTDLSGVKAIVFSISTDAQLFFGDTSSTDEITVSDNECQLVEGANKFTVLAEDGETSATYTVTVAIAKSNEAVLKSLRIDSKNVSLKESSKTGFFDFKSVTDFGLNKTIQFAVSANAKLYMCDGLHNASPSNQIISGSSYKIRKGGNKFTVVAENGTTAVVYNVTIRGIELLTPISRSAKVLKIKKFNLPYKFSSATNIHFTSQSAPANGICRFGNLPDDSNLLFLAAEPGEYTIRALSNEYAVDITINVTLGAQPNPYIAKVFDYVPGIGQFTNTMPKYDTGDTQKTMNTKVQNTIAGPSGSMITLGGCGGYVTIGFDHTIMNREDLCDFRIEGNAFKASSNPYHPSDGSEPPYGGSCEPGVVFVAYDKNGNGKPDDNEWYEIAGSGYESAEEEPWYDHIHDDGGMDTDVYRNYAITYKKPTSEPTGDVPEYIEWSDNQGYSGWLPKNQFHSQSYYPQWLPGNSYTLRGTRLGQNAMDESGSGNYFVLYAYSYGYVDNFPNNDPRSAIDIDWAVDKKGNKVHLPGIDFVKIQNGVNQVNGWLGECSTEVAKGYDLHLLGKEISSDF